MTPEELAARLHGRQYREEGEAVDKSDAKKAGLVIVYGASDDLCELDGAIYDEADCCDGGLIRIHRKGLFQMDDDDIEVLEKYNVLEHVKKDTVSFEAIWSGTAPDGRSCSWHYKVPFAHATFDIMEDGELYCQGFVFRLDDAFSEKEGA